MGWLRRRRGGSGRRSQTFAGRLFRAAGAGTSACSSSLSPSWTTPLLSTAARPQRTLPTGYRSSRDHSAGLGPPAPGRLEPTSRSRLSSALCEKLKPQTLAPELFRAGLLDRGVALTGGSQSEGPAVVSPSLTTATFSAAICVTIELSAQSTCRASFAECERTGCSATAFVRRSSGTPSS